MNTWNPWHGCRKYSEGCRNCYMFYLDKKRGADGSKIYKAKTNFDLPLKRDRNGIFKLKPPAMVYVCMTSDFFLEEADSWRKEVWQMIKYRDDLDFWIQTKRVERINENLPKDWGNGYKNVTMCITAENQEQADKRLPMFLDIPAKSRAVMCAPILSEIDIEKYLETGKIDLVLADGENYEGFRPCRYEWIKLLSDTCKKFEVRFDFVGTGNIFIKDGKVYKIPKAYMAVQAKRSGLSVPPGDTDIPLNPRCRECKYNGSCSGCSWCGKCGAKIEDYRKT